MHVRQRNETPAIFRPALQDRQIRKRERIRLWGLGFGYWDFLKQVHYFLARPFLRMLRPGVQEIESLFEEAPPFAQIGWRFCLEDKLNFLRKIFDAADLQRHRHAFPRSHRVDGQRKL
jgi:hypothetical protein